MGVDEKMRIGNRWDGEGRGEEGREEMDKETDLEMHQS
jgi:hypothetical protein